MKEFSNLRKSLNANNVAKFLVGGLSLVVIFYITLLGSESVFTNKYAETGAVILSEQNQVGEVLGATTPQLPDSSKDFSMAYTQRSCTTTVPSGGNLQTYLDNVNPGDVLCLTADATYTGNFLIRKKNTDANHWIIITTTKESFLPIGKRVAPSDAGYMPKLITITGAKGAFRTEPGASYYRIIGLEVTADPSDEGVPILARVGEDSANQDTLAEVPHHIILDRLYVHGYPNRSLGIGIAFDGMYGGVINSYITEVKAKSFGSGAASGSGDEVALLVGNTPGPVKIENNFIASAGINFFIGGSDPNLGAQGITEDVWFRGNYVKKESAWKGPYLTKNLFELKYGRRVLVEGNVFENYWGSPATSQFYAVVLKSANQKSGGDTSCTSPNPSPNDNGRYSQTADVTFRYNEFKNVSSAFMVAAAAACPYPHILAVGHHFHIHDNLILGLGTYSGTGIPAYFFEPDGYPKWTGNELESARNTIVENNTIASPAASITYVNVNKSKYPAGTGTYYLPKTYEFIFRNNIVSGKINLAGTSVSASTISTAFPGAVMQGNVVVGSQGANLLGSGNYTKSSYGGLLAADNSFLSSSGVPGSPGANIPKVNSCTSGVRTGTWSGCNGGGGGNNPYISVSITASPSSMTLPTNQTTLTWATSGNPTSCTASNYWSGQKTPSGSGERRTGMPAGTYIFDITCSKSGLADATDSVAVVVNPVGGGGGADTVLPSISISSPLNNASVSGNVSITANASDNVGVSKVEFYIDDVYKSVDSSSPYSYSWNTSGVSLGSHTILAKAFDAAQNTKSSSIDVTLTSGNNGGGGGGCTNPSPLDQAYVAPCPVLNLSANNISGSSPLTVSVSPQGSIDAFYVYKIFYVSEETNACPGGASKISGAWCPLTFSGNPVSGDTNYLTTANYTLSSSQISQLSSGTHYVISWDWAWNGTCFLGPGNSSCDNGKWRLQSFIKQ